MSEQNLLADHPDGLGKHISVILIDHMSVEDANNLIRDRKEVGEITTFIRGPVEPGLYYLVSFGTDLVHDAGSLGETFAQHWIESPTGIHYLNEAMRWLGFPEREVN